MRQLLVSSVAFTTRGSAARPLCRGKLFPEVSQLVFILRRSIYRDVVVCIKQGQHAMAAVEPPLFLFVRPEEERTFTMETSLFYITRTRPLKQ